MALAAIASILYGAEFLFSSIATAFEIGEALELGGLSIESAYTFSEGELALFSDFGTNSYELGQSIRSTAQSAASIAKTGKQATEIVQSGIEYIQSKNV